ncbi:meiotic nuclear division protein 1 homolog isoform X2 [Oncorhynchus kisutch]|uniref:meiotic nuclear division protein 1 homolog isoform X2 n=1 Tax=Oncorhynchus kisutch TaxID=8019 RepID=UPI00099F8FD7|nr:meiotic nuclear division protein 1 homolog isoform X2 [Oncorhynchus kisutch]
MAPGYESQKKGLSLEEKRTRMMEIFFETHTEEKQRKMSLQQAVDKSKVGREETEERATLLKELQALREKRSHLKAKLEKYRECDPEVIEEMRKSNVTAKEAVSRWTDNVFAIKSWAKRNFGFDDGRIDKAFGIPEDLDYID